MGHAFRVAARCLCARFPRRVWRVQWRTLAAALPGTRSGDRARYAALTRGRRACTHAETVRRIRGMHPRGSRSERVPLAIAVRVVG
jgi:hypothetical protein